MMMQEKLLKQIKKKNKKLKIKKKLEVFKIKVKVMDLTFLMDLAHVQIKWFASEIVMVCITEVLVIAKMTKMFMEQLLISWELYKTYFTILYNFTKIPFYYSFSIMIAW